MDNYVAGGITFVSDDVGSGVQAPVAKMAFGPNGTATQVDTATPLPVAEQGGVLTALQLIDDMIATLGSAIPAKATLVAGSDGTNARALRVTDSNGRLSVDINSLPNVTLTGSLPAGGNVLGYVNVAAILAGSNNIGRITLQDSGGDLANITAGGLLETNCNQAGTWVVNEAPRATGGLTTFCRKSTNTTNAVVIKGTPGQIYSILVSNKNAAQVFLKLYNQTGTPNLAVDVPLLTIPIPGNTAGVLVPINFPAGLAFSSGIAMALTGAIGDSDTTAVTANEQVIIVGYN